MGNEVFQRRARRLQRQYERSRHNRRSRRGRVRVVDGEVRVDKRQALVFEQRGGEQSMVDEGRTGRSGGVLAVCDESARTKHERSGFPRVVGCGGGDDDIGALGLEKLGCVHEVCFVCEHGFCDTAVMALNTGTKGKIEERTRRQWCTSSHTQQPQDCNPCAHCRSGSNSLRHCVQTR